MDNPKFSEGSVTYNGKTVNVDEDLLLDYALDSLLDNLDEVLEQIQANKSK